MSIFSDVKKLKSSSIKETFDSFRKKLSDKISDASDKLEELNEQRQEVKKEKEIAKVLNMSRGNVAMAYAKGLRAIKSYINNKRTPKRRI